MRSIAILDASALFAATDRAQVEHRACADVIRRRDLDLVIPTLALAEAAYLVGTHLGPREEVAFIRGIRRFAIESPEVEDWTAIADVAERYSDLALGTTDAATVVLADRLDTDLIVTLDRRHFATVRSPNGRRFRLLPDSTAVHEESEPYEPTAG